MDARRVSYRVEAIDTGRLSMTGMLLIVSWVLFALLAGFGTPGDWDRAQNLLR